MGTFTKTNSDTFIHHTHTHTSTHTHTTHKQHKKQRLDMDMERVCAYIEQEIEQSTSIREQKLLVAEFGLLDAQLSTLLTMLQDTEVCMCLLYVSVCRAMCGVHFVRTRLLFVSYFLLYVCMCARTRVCVFVFARYLCFSLSFLCHSDSQYPLPLHTHDTQTTNSSTPLPCWNSTKMNCAWSPAKSRTSRPGWAWWKKRAGCPNLIGAWPTTTSKKASARFARAFPFM